MTIVTWACLVFKNKKASKKEKQDSNLSTAPNEHALLFLDTIAHIVLHHSSLTGFSVYGCRHANFCLLLLFNIVSFFRYCTNDYSHLLNVLVDLHHASLSRTITLSSFIILTFNSAYSPYAQIIYHQYTTYKVVLRIYE